MAWHKTEKGWKSPDGRWEIEVRRHLAVGRMNRVLLNDKRLPMGGGGVFSTLREAKKYADKIVTEELKATFERWRAKGEKQ